MVAGAGRICLLLQLVHDKVSDCKVLALASLPIWSRPVVSWVPLLFHGAGLFEQGAGLSFTAAGLFLDPCVCCRWRTWIKPCGSARSRTEVLRDPYTALDADEALTDP